MYAIESSLPSNFFELFEIKDKSSNDYTYTAHRVGAELIQISESARKNGDTLRSYRLLRLANYVFPYRDDIAQKYRSIVSQGIKYLNESAKCDEYYKTFVEEIMLTQPEVYNKIDQKKCPELILQISGVSPQIRLESKMLSAQSENENFQIHKKMQGLSQKAILSTSDLKEIKRLLVKAYLGSIELRSHSIRQFDDRLTAVFEITRKYNSISYEELKSIWATLTGQEFKEREFLFGNQLRIRLNFLQGNKMTSYPATIVIDNMTYFDIWLKTLNFFNFDNYPYHSIAVQNDSHAFKFHVERAPIKMNFAESKNSHPLYNHFDFRNIPRSIQENLKEIIIHLN